MSRLLLLAAAAGPVFVLRDEFADTVAAGALNGTPAVPGPGARTVTGNHSTDGSDLVLPGAASSIYWSLAAGASDLQRVAGRVIAWTFSQTPTAGNGYLGMFEASTRRHVIYTLYGGSPAMFRIYAHEPAMNAFGYLRRASEHPNAITRARLLLGADNLRTFFADDFGLQLAWVSLDYTYTNNFRFGSSSLTLNGKLDSVQIKDTTVRSLDDTALLDQTNPVTGAEYEVTNGRDLMRGSAFHILTITAPDPLSGSLTLYFRYIDADNHISVAITDTGAVVWTWRYKGVNTTTETDAAAIAAGNSITLYLRLSEYAVYGGARVGNAWAATWEAFVSRSGQFWDVATEPTCLVQAATGFAVTRWRAYPLMSSDYAQLATPRTALSLMSVGDSKTFNYLWQGALLTALNALGVDQWAEWPGMLAAGGWSVALVRAAIEAGALAYRYGYADHVLINLGSNDLSALPAESTWKADYRAILEAFHAAYPDAKLYLAKPVRLTADPPAAPVADSATLWGWIDDLVADYDHVYAGIDETDLEGGDSYATNLSDLTHYSAAGAAAAAALWQTVLGY